MNIQQPTPTRLQNSTEISEYLSLPEPQQSIWPMGDFVLSDEPFGNGLFSVSASFSHCVFPQFRGCGFLDLRNYVFDGA
jgi:hypothetical protein